MLKHAKETILTLAAVSNLANRITYTLKLGVDIPYVDSGDTQQAAVDVLRLQPKDLLAVLDETKSLYEEEIKVFS